MVVIRLARGGAKKRPFYHLVVTDKHSRRDSGYIERVGYFNPSARGAEIPLSIKMERVTHWQSMGAQPSHRVALLLSKYETEGEKPAAEQVKPIKKKAGAKAKAAEAEAKGAEAKGAEAKGAKAKDKDVEAKGTETKGAKAKAKDAEAKAAVTQEEAKAAKPAKEAAAADENKAQAESAQEPQAKTEENKEKDSE
ncbi:MAG: 30S ribosomal protein S16 [Gammaproteobacteria bacterium]